VDRDKPQETPDKGRLSRGAEAPPLHRISVVDEQIDIRTSSCTEGFELSGFYVVNVADLQAAREWAARVPAGRHGAIEVQPIMEWPEQ